MTDRTSEELSASAARRRFRRAGWAMIGIGVIFPWFGYPLFAWLAGICAAALVLGVMILKRSYLATALGLLAAAAASHAMEKAPAQGAVD